jgi:hypothetical protein
MSALSYNVSFADVILRAMERINMKRGIIVLALASVALSVNAQSLSEDFINVPGLFTSGWLNVNNSVLPTTNAWLQGSPTGWFDGPGGVGDASYALADYGSSGATTPTGGTLSVWMLTPILTFNNGSTISFQSKSAGNGYADRLQVRLGSNGSDANVGSLPEDVGTYNNVLLDVNSAETAAGYPTTWTTYNITVSGLTGATSTRLAFRYYVHDGGPGGNNSNGIGVDTLRVAPVPEPATISALALGAIALIKRRRRNA